MSSRSFDWVKPGAPVIFRSSGWGGGWGAMGKIAKVYKNGNFVIEGHEGQYRPHADYANKAGDTDRWVRDAVYPATEGNLAEAKRDRISKAAQIAVRNEVERLEELLRTRNVEAIIAEAERIGERAE